MMEKRAKKIHLLPNFLTAFGLTCGLYVIFKMSVTPVQDVTAPFLTIAAGLLVMAGVFDLLDGAVARALGATSDFGGIFDSLADAVSFGVAPAVMVLKSVPYHLTAGSAFFLTTSALVFAVCGVLRLVRFSSGGKVQNDQPKPVKKYFMGLPIPASAGALVSLNLFLKSEDLEFYFTLSLTLKVLLLSFSMIVLGYFMVSHLKFPTIRHLYFRISNFQMVFWVVLGAVTIFYGILHHFAVVFLAVSWIYIAASVLLGLVRWFRGSENSDKGDEGALDLHK